MREVSFNINSRAFETTPASAELIVNDDSPLESPAKENFAAASFTNIPVLAIMVEVDLKLPSNSE